MNSFSINLPPNFGNEDLRRVIDILSQEIQKLREELKELKDKLNEEKN